MSASCMGGGSTHSKSGHFKKKTKKKTPKATVLMLFSTRILMGEKQVVITHVIALHQLQGYVLQVAISERKSACVPAIEQQIRSQNVTQQMAMATLLGSQKSLIASNSHIVIFQIRLPTA